MTAKISKLAGFCMHMQHKVLDTIIIQDEKDTSQGTTFPFLPGTPMKTKAKNPVSDRRLTRFFTHQQISNEQKWNLQTALLL